jgi:hypothetical protein
MGCKKSEKLAEKESQLIKLHGTFFSLRKTFFFVVVVVRFRIKKNEKICSGREKLDVELGSVINNTHHIM